jgi:hypothetical protein
MATVRSPLTGPTTTGPLPRWRSSTLIALVAVTALVLAGCGSDDGDESTEGESTTETTAATATDSDPGSTEGSSTESTTSSTPEGGETTTSEVVSALSPGDPCSLEEGLPDCIDPDGDGEGTYLVDGSDCAATAPDISVCEDLDGDGVAGYPDEYEDLPTCSAEVPPPCNNPPGSSNDE